MTVKLADGSAASPASIKALETDLGFQISDSFREFISTQDGASPETNIFRVSEKNQSGVNEFIPAASIAAERTYLENLPQKAYPVAWAEGGNYVFIDEGRNGEVFYWDHEVPEEISRLADNFAAFLALLKPFDIKSIKIKPGQVKRVWVDPEFLKQLQNQKK